MRSPSSGACARRTPLCRPTCVCRRTRFHAHGRTRSCHSRQSRPGSRRRRRAAGARLHELRAARASTWVDALTAASMRARDAAGGPHARPSVFKHDCVHLSDALVRQLGNRYQAIYMDPPLARPGMPAEPGKVTIEQLVRRPSGPWGPKEGGRVAWYGLTSSNTPNGPPARAPSRAARRRCRSPS